MVHRWTRTHTHHLLSQNPQSLAFRIYLESDYFLPPPAAFVLVQATIILSMNYCNNFLTGLPASALTTSWSILKRAARTDAFKIKVKPCQSHTQNLPIASKHTQSKSQVLTMPTIAKWSFPDTFDLTSCYTPLKPSASMLFPRHTSARHFLCLWYPSLNICSHTSFSLLSGLYDHYIRN